MQTSENGKALIRHFEGLHLKAYRCGSHKWTIGYGHTSGVQKGDIISVDQAEAFLGDDLSVAESAVDVLVNVPLSQSQFDALVSFVFNVGQGRFRTSTLLSKLNSGNYEEAAEEFLRWVYAAGELLPGLERRRKAEKALFRNEAVIL
jgi:lysozyme